MMTAVLAGLSNATVAIRNTAGPNVITSSSPFKLSSSPGYVLADGTIIVYGLTAKASYDGSGGTLGSVSLGNITLIPISVGPMALVAISSDDHSLVFNGAIIPPPNLGSAGNGSLDV